MSLAAVLSRTNTMYKFENMKYGVPYGLFSMSSIEPIKKYRNKNEMIRDLSGVTLSKEVSVKPWYSLGLAEVVKRGIYASIYHNATYKELVYRCPLTGDDTPLVPYDFRGDKDLSDSLSKIMDDVMGYVHDDAHTVIINFILNGNIERDIVYDVHFSGLSICIRNLGSFKDYRYDMALLEKQSERRREDEEKRHYDRDLGRDLYGIYNESV